MSAKIYLEGASTGKNSKELQIRCREGFRKLLEKCELQGAMPRLTASGSRSDAFKDFKIAHKQRGKGDYVGLWVDSEDPVENVEAPWKHLTIRDGWEKPEGASDEQVLLMTTCMETWIAADRQALAKHFGSCLQESALPPLEKLEARSRHDVFNRLVKATQACRAPYGKDAQSFELLGELDPKALEASLPSFARCRRVLKATLG